MANGRKELANQINKAIISTESSSVSSQNEPLQLLVAGLFYSLGFNYAHTVTYGRLESSENGARPELALDDNLIFYQNVCSVSGLLVS
ncbi:hypothetical protein BpHYR1_000397 [Brachionus plicatilis]|uniref:Uncharacterized protein n=1 Tax=Brachionus plicatilis TaxID=10195 RepID=A0A3M7Q6C1_BRAPC|nr:hypothetical protein BpHYR1_000397 [Brachionus plicatilis]